MARVGVIRCHYYRDTRLQREVAALLDRGHTVHVVCLRGTGERLREHRGLLTITRIPIRHSPGAGTARRLAEYVAFFVLVSFGLGVEHLRHRFQVVQVNSVPDVLVFVALLPRLTGARVLLDLQEPLPEFFVTRSGVGERHPAVRLLEAFEQASIRFADATVTVTEQMRQVFIARGATPDKITVVMDGSDEEVFKPARLPRPPRGRDRFVLVSHGTIEPYYGLDTAVRAVAQLVAAIPSLELRILGDGSQRSELRALAASVGIADRIVFSSGFVPIDELVASLAAADVGVVAMKQDRFRDLTLAGKMFDYITMGIPMVVSTTRSVKETFPAGCFEPFESGDPHDLARAIRRLYDDPSLATSYATRAKDVAAPYSWAAQRRIYWEVVDALLEPAQTTDRCHGPLSVTVTPQPGVSVLGMWDELVQKVPGSDVTQLSAWADIRRAAGFEPLYVFAWRRAELVGGALVMWRRLPLVGDVGYVPYGPVIALDADRELVVTVLAAALSRLAHGRLRMLFVQPPLGGEDISLELRRQGFRRSHAGIAPEASVRLDLAQDEDTLRAGLSKDMRRRARKWPQLGVGVRRGMQDDVTLLARLHAASAQHQGFEPIPLDYIANLYRRLAPAAHAELFIGEMQGKPVFADLLTCCGGVLKGRLTGMDRGSSAARAGVAAAVRWETIRWAKANGYRWFDFGGIRDSSVAALVDKLPNSPPVAGDDAFKVSFGGTPFRYATPVEIISSPVVRVAYDLTRRWPAGRRLVERTSNRLRANRTGGGGGPMR